MPTKKDIIDIINKVFEAILPFLAYSMIGLWWLGMGYIPFYLIHLMMTEELSLQQMIIFSAGVVIAWATFLYFLWAGIKWLADLEITGMLRSVLNWHPAKIFIIWSIFLYEDYLSYLGSFVFPYKL